MFNIKYCKVDYYLKLYACLGGGRKLTFGANLKLMGNSFRRNVVKPFYSGDLLQKKHKSLSGLVHSTTNLKNKFIYPSRGSLSGQSSDGNSDGSFSNKKSFYESFPVMFGGSGPICKNNKKSKKNKLLKMKSEKCFSHNLIPSEKSKNNLHNESILNNKERIDEETENDLKADKTLKNSNNFSISNEFFDEESKKNYAIETPIFRIPDILVKQRFDRLKSSKSASILTVPKSLVSSTFSLHTTTESVFKPQFFNNNYKCNGFFIN